MPREPIACDDAEARRYLGCTACKWEELKRRRIVKPLCRGWFAYEDLDQAIVDLRKERDNKGNIIEIHETAEKRRKVRSAEWSSEELLFPGR